MFKKNILVVDDEEMIRNLLKEAFSRAGYTVRTAESAEAALKTLAAEKIWVMLLDLKLPGMSGVELCRKIRNDYPLAILFAVTGYASLFELSECREAGFDDYFTKPVTLSLLLEAVNGAFERLERWKKK
jgi:DNA-binding response OmpR family regulator